MGRTSSTRDEEAVSLLEEVTIIEKNTPQLHEKLHTAFTVRRHALKSCAWQCMLLLLPSFISSRLRGSDRSETPDKLRPTAYLDGLRGFAAWTVLNAHLSAIIDKTSDAGWGHGGTNFEIYKLPIVRLLFCGNFAVGLFFVISGFALSISFLSSLRKQPRDPGVAFQKLASSIARRPFRLFLPSWVSMFVVFCLIRFNFFARLQTRQVEFEEVVTGWPVLGSWPPRQPSFFSQLLDVVSVDTDFFQIFVEPIHDSFKLAYNPVLWTVKLEFRSSLVLFLTHAALFFMKKPARVAITTILIIAGVSVFGFDAPHFWAGYLIAEFTDLSAPSKNRGFFKTLFYATLMATGLFLGSFASWDPENTVWCAWLIPFTPFHFAPVDRFWAGFGATLTILSFNGLPWVVRIFNSRLIQYFGKISFALYLVHFWMVHTFGTVLFYYAWSITGKDSIAATTAGFLMAYPLLLFCIVWVADIFWRCVDIPLVAATSRWQKLLFLE